MAVLWIWFEWLHCCFVVWCSGPKSGVLLHPLPQGSVHSDSPEDYFSAARRINVHGNHCLKGLSLRGANNPTYSKECQLWSVKIFLHV